jgi:mRNA interferase HigB
MRVISKKRLRVFWTIYPIAKIPLDNWFRIAKKGDWSKFAEVKATFGSVDQVGKYLVFNIGGQKYRLICEINYQRHTVFVRHVLTHAEYNDGAWKKS